VADQAPDQQRRAGWKKDPSGRHFGRYWDGETWTEYVISAEKVQDIDPLPPRPASSVIPDSAPPTPVAARRPTTAGMVVGPAQPPARSTPPSPVPTDDEAPRRQAAMIALGGAGAVAVGCFLPWAKLTVPFIGTVTRSGMDGGNGVIFLGLAGATAVVGGRLLSSTPEQLGRYRLGLAVLALALVVLTGTEVADLRTLFTEVSDPEAQLRPSYGSGVWLVGLGAAATVVASVRMPRRVSSSSHAVTAEQL